MTGIASRRRVAQGPLETAVAEALGKLRAARITDHRVHQARRALKKAGAALRVLRPQVGERTYQIENVTLRDAARLLAPLRDAKARLETFDDLRSQEAKRLRGVELEGLHQVLVAELAGARRWVRRPSGPLEECVALLEAHAGRMSGRSPTDERAEPLTDSVLKIYRRGRKALQAVRDEATAETLHEWRKQVKYLHHAVECLRPRFGEKAEKLLVRTDRVAGRLGDDHDLSVLLEFASRRVPDSLDPTAAEILAAVIARRRGKLQKAALKLGARLYRFKSARFLHRLTEGAG